MGCLTMRGTYRGRGRYRGRKSLVPACCDAHKSRFRYRFRPRPRLSCQVLRQPLQPRRIATKQNPQIGWADAQTQIYFSQVSGPLPRALSSWAMFIVRAKPMLSAKKKAVFAIVLIAVFISQLAAGYGTSEVKSMQVDDFVQYWAAARLTIEGGNPYDPQTIMAVVHRVFPSLLVTLRLWNPPWTISLILPFGLLDYRSARMLWALIHMIMILGSATWLWRFYGGQASTALLVGIVALLFPAGLISLAMGQISPVVLFGLCAFLYFENKGRELSAGFMASVTLVKPHLVCLVWVAILLWSIYRRRWNVLAGAALAISGLMIVPTLLNHNIVTQYLAAIRDNPPDSILTPTAGALVRLIVGWEKRWVEILPNLIGVVWLVWYWWPRRNGWKWKDQLPVISVVSMLVAVYGYLFDQIVFLIPAIQIACQSVKQLRTQIAKVVLMMLTLACALSMFLWSFCIHLIGQPRNAHFGTAISFAFSEPNQFWEIVILPVFAITFFMGWKGVLHVFDKTKTPSDPCLIESLSKH